MRAVALEEHISLPKFKERLSKDALIARGWPDPSDESSPLKRVQYLLADVEAERLSSMNAAGITMQVLSVAAPDIDVLEPAEAIPYACDYNDAIARLTAAHPQRFAGFAVLPLKTPDAAAEEFQRAVTKLGFCGTLINGTIDGRFLDDKIFAPVLSQAEELDVPIYLHPNIPPPPVMQAYYSDLPDQLGFRLSMAGFGWHAETAIHLLRMILAGTFDRHPQLKVIIGHMGEMLPMMMVRIDSVFKDAGLQRTVIEVLKSQVFITTSGLFTQPPLQIALDTFGVDQIMFSVDYPYSTNEQGRKFLDEINLPAADIEKIAHGNADRLLKLKPE